MIPLEPFWSPLSFSEPSRVALVLAARLARHCGADLHVLYVEDLRCSMPRRATSGSISPDTPSVNCSRFIADAWPAVLCSPQVHVVAGADVDVILDVVHRQAADLIVIDGALYLWG